MRKRWIIGSTAILALGIGVLVYAAEDEVIVSPTGLYEAEDGVLLFTDEFHNAVWQFEEGNYTLLAGGGSVRDENGLPLGGRVDGAALEATFDDPFDITTFLDGYAIADTGNHLIRFYDPINSIVATVGGDAEGYENGVGGEVRFSRPSGIVTLEDGSLLVADTGNHVIRQITEEGEVSLFAGVPNTPGEREGDVQIAEFNEPTGLYYEEGVLYVADSGNHRICKIEEGTVSVMAGLLGEGYADGPADEAQFSWPMNFAMHEGVLYVADSGNGAIRTLENGEVETFLEMGEAQDGFAPIDPRALYVEDGEVWVGDVFAHDLFSVSLST